MTCKTWSMTAAMTFQGLCTMTLEAETGTDTKQCRVCVVPVSVPAGSSGSGSISTESGTSPP